MNKISSIILWDHSKFLFYGGTNQVIHIIISAGTNVLSLNELILDLKKLDMIINLYFKDSISQIEMIEKVNQAYAILGDNNNDREFHHACFKLTKKSPLSVITYVSEFNDQRIDYPFLQSLKIKEWIIINTRNVMKYIENYVNINLYYECDCKVSIVYYDDMYMEGENDYVVKI